MTLRFVGILFLCLSCSGILSLICYSLRIIKTAGGRPFVFFMASVFIYSLGYMLELSGNSAESIFFALKIEYLGIPFIPVFWFLFAFEYNQYRIKSRLLHASLFTIPAITLVLFYTTNEYHLYYSKFDVDVSGSFPVASFAKGAWYYVQFAYAQALSLAGVVLFFDMTRKSKGYRKRQANVIFLASIIPWCGNALEQLGVTLPGIDMIPFYLALPIPAFSLAMARMMMFNIAPIARTKVFETMQTPVLVLDKDFNIADFNEFASKVLPELTQASIGLGAREVLQERDGFMDRITTAGDAPTEVELRYRDDTIHFSVSATKILSSRGNDLGFAVLLYDITENKRLMKALHKMASLDALTQVCSRRFFMDSCMIEINRVVRYGGNLPFLLIDIDHFKKVNDTFGHIAGDLVLQNVTSTFRKVLRASDIIGRYGGEEFAILLPETDLEGARRLAERLCNEVRSTTTSCDGDAIKVTISVGVAFFSTGERMWKESGQALLEALLKASDQALYRAKSNGRDQVQCAELSPEA
ncbi:histidine kinase N-terminal 7TM domain-containing protein [Pseudodesulfovibrio sp.]|uniref:histidine kinase N-terminal 7TM domain-containing diguanylate cyclase n=1 Tax=Pseudodesulfovibrio sp. TaxID=2035812 RepID=UPI0026231F39|nr:histidine kinase N-terminal 7TM domain-containing protein [Pseudodesulfovibrio sp.]MDD3311587.1 diguanylate cyclase [Pseudodesulfovibrio sp.]